MIDVELMTPHHLTVGYTGAPGDRTFYLQAQDDETLLTLRMEKLQVQGIGELLGQLLTRVEDAPATDWDRAAMDLRPPIDPRWQVGEISLGVDPDVRRFVIEIVELDAADFGAGDPDPDDPDAGELEGDDGDEDDDEEIGFGDDDRREARVWCDQDQARRLAAHAKEIVAQGRPRCELCGRPTDADGGHVCPATNGHGRLSR